jgi:uncharacterized membrane-anchored protein
MTKRTGFIKFALQVMVLGVLALSLSGCDQLRSKVADLIAPQSPQDALKAATALLDAGEYPQARDKAVARVEKQDAPLRGEFALVAAKAYAYLGDVDGVIRYLTIAVSSLDLSPDEPMSDPAFQELRTNVRFLQAITQLTPQRPAPSKSQQSEKAQGIEANSGAGTQIKMNGNGTEVRAGDIVIKLPN